MSVEILLLNQNFGKDVYLSKNYCDLVDQKFHLLTFVSNFSNTHSPLWPRSSVGLCAYMHTLSYIIDCIIKINYNVQYQIITHLESGKYQNHYWLQNCWRTPKVNKTFQFDVQKNLIMLPKVIQNCAHILPQSTILINYYLYNIKFC